MEKIKYAKESGTRMKKMLYLFIAIGLLLSACSNDEEEGTTEGGGQNGENRYPLTGLYTDEPVDNRIVGVMINNHQEARPQSGLTEADIVFEILAESSITRFLALYQSELPDQIGPIRSAREYYFDLANRYDALYVYHGAADFIDQMIVDQGIDYLNGREYDNDGVLFQRDSSRQAPHNSYLLGNAIYETAESKGYDTKMDEEALPFLEEEELEELDGERAEHIEVVYSEHSMEEVGFTFDSEAGNYIRSSGGEETLDLETNEPVRVENVFIIETHHEIIDDEGRRAVDLDSGGNAYFIQNGIAQQVQWENDNGRIVPVKDGVTLGFVPGKTWINVVPMNPSMEESVTISGSSVELN